MSRGKRQYVLMRVICSLVQVFSLAVSLFAAILLIRMLFISCSTRRTSQGFVSELYSVGMPVLTRDSDGVGISIIPFFLITSIYHDLFSLPILLIMAEVSYFFFYLYGFKTASIFYNGYGI